MKPVAANLKTLYQCPALWLLHLIGGYICIHLIVRPLLHPQIGGGFFSGYVAVTLWSGMIAASLAKDILVKPFSFCLPGHSRVARKVLLLIGAVVSAVCALTFLTYPADTVMEILSAIWSAFALGLVVYMIGALLFVVQNHGGVVWAILITLVAFMDHDAFLSVRVAIERTTVERPLEISLLAGLALVITWKKLQGRRLARKLCGANYFPPHAFWSTIRTERFQNAEKVKRLKIKPGRLMKASESYFLPRLTKHPRGTANWFPWGFFYNIVGAALHARRANFLLLVTVILLGTAILGYVGPTRIFPDISLANFILFAGSVVIGTFFKIHPFTTMLLPVSRREKFRHIVLTGLAGGVAALIIGVLIIAVSIFVDHFIHEVSLFGKTLTYMPLIPKTLFYFLLILPVLLVSKMLFPKHYGLVDGIVVGVAVGVFEGAHAAILKATPVEITLLLLASWLPFVGISFHCCFSKDLVLK